MFKPNYDICRNCKTKQLIVVKKGLCKKCNQETKVLNKKVQSKNTKYAFKRKKRKTGELEVFKQIYEERPNICEWCGTYINEFSVANYHHIKPKSRFPELRLVKENIIKICFDCHFKEHNG